MNILDFGAIADGETVCTAAIQAAVDACNAQGGGTVVVPAGHFITGTIWLKSNVELHLEMGALLEGSKDLADYCKAEDYPQNTKSLHEEWNGAHLILALEADNVALTGPGTIDGRGEYFFEENVPPYHPRFFWPHGMKKARDKENLRPGQMCVFCECTHVRVSDLTLQNSTCWTLFLHGCTDAIVRGLNITNPSVNGNTDGIDIDCCDCVTVSDCIIHTGDDAITLRGNPSRLNDKTRACSNITITNCVLECSVCGFRIGVGEGVIHDASISNILIKKVGHGFLFQSAYDKKSKGTTISDIGISNVQIDLCANPFIITSGQPSAISKIKDIHFNGLYAHCYADCIINGSDLTQPEHIQVHDMDLIMTASPYKLLSPDEYPTTLFRFEHARDIIFDSVRVRWEDDAEPTWQKTLSTEDATFEIRDNCRLPEPR